MGAYDVQFDEEDTKDGMTVNVTDREGTKLFTMYIHDQGKGQSTVSLVFNHAPLQARTFGWKDQRKVDPSGTSARILVVELTRLPRNYVIPEDGT